MAVLLSAGQQIPAPLSVRGFLDTGSDVTCVASWVLRQLGLSMVQSRSTQTISGPANVDLFEVSLTISGPAGKAGPILVREQLIIMELPQDPSDLDVLVGRDVLAECLVIFDWPGQRFTLAF
jgi:hypothetical protein